LTLDKVIEIIQKVDGNNSLLPSSVSIRTTLIEQLVTILRGYGKEVSVSYY